MPNTTKPQEHEPHNSSEDHGCGCGGAHKHHKPTPKENVAQAGDSKSKTAQEHDEHSGCCGSGKVGK